MAILIQRSRLWFVWLLTRHPRFKPLYHSDVVMGDTIEQSEFLASAGYYVAAAMLARLAIEMRVKRYAMLTPEWTEYRKADSVYGFAVRLRSHGRIGSSTQKRIASLYSQASGIVHGESSEAERCRNIIRGTMTVCKKLDNNIAAYVKGGCPPIAA